MTTYGYARVSGQDQRLAGHLEALKAAGETAIYRESAAYVRTGLSSRS